MLFFIIRGMVIRARSRLMAHQTILRGIFAVVTFKTVFHTGADHVAVKVIPIGDTGMTTTAFSLLMLFMGKEKTGAQSFAGSFCFAGLFKMAKAAVAFLAGLEMTFETALLARSPKSIVDFWLLSKNAADIRGYDTGWP